MALTTLRPAPSTPATAAPVPTPRAIARALAARTELWQPLVRFAEPRWHTRFEVGPHWEAWLLSWLPGQRTGLHDHGGSAGAFAVLSGTVEETLPVGSDDQARTRLVSRRYPAGVVRPFGPEHVHDVAVLDGGPAVTLHVYAPRLSTMTRYRLADGRLIVTAREQEGQDW